MKPEIDATELSGAALARIRTMKLFGINQYDRDYMRKKIMAIARRPKEHHDIVRQGVGLIGFPQACPRPSCRRARRCTTTWVVCQFEREYDYEIHCNRFAENHEKYGDPFHGMQAATPPRTR